MDKGFIIPNIIFFFVLRLTDVEEFRYHIIMHDTGFHNQW